MYVPVDVKDRLTPEQIVAILMNLEIVLYAPTPIQKYPPTPPPPSKKKPQNVLVTFFVTILRLSLTYIGIKINQQSN